ncbi:MAG: hypothetical protein KHZ62_11410 [Clostridiales bacterium]|nr:hypothetical protein [Clostridiales bacterium]
MKKGEKKEYEVTVKRAVRTPEEDRRITREITTVLYECKMLALERQKEKKKA